MARPAATRPPEFKPRSDVELESLRQELVRAFQRRDAVDEELRRLIAGAGAGGSGAPTGAPYVTTAASGALTAERVLTAGTNITLTDGGANSTMTIDAASGAPVGASYVVIATNATLTSERVLTAGTSLSLTDGGANGNATIAVANLGIGTAQIAADAVTYAKIQNVTTNRLLGRDTAGAGDVEELTLGAGLGIGVAGAGTVSLGEWGECSVYGNETDVVDTVPVEISATNNGTYLGRRDDVLAFYEIRIAEVGRTIYEVDFTTLANNTFANGAEVIDGLNWTAASVAVGTRTIFDILNGTGLRWTAPTSAATDFTTAAQTAAHLYIDLTAFALYRPEEDLIIEVQYTGTFENGNDGFLFGLWGQANNPIGGAASAIRMDMVGRVNSGGTQTLRSLHNATQGTALVDVNAGGTTDVAMGRFRNNGTFDQFFGTYSGGFPTAIYQAAAHQPTTQTAANPMFASLSRLALAFRCASDASPTSAVTLQRMRLRTAV
jgi:hypothetical protein